MDSLEKLADFGGLLGDFGKNKHKNFALKF